MKANETIDKEYSVIEQEINGLKGDSHNLNQEIDSFINTFGVIDDIEMDVKKTEDNIEVIFKSIHGIRKSKVI